MIVYTDLRCFFENVPELCIAIAHVSFCVENNLFLGRAQQRPQNGTNVLVVNLYCCWMGRCTNFQGLFLSYAWTSNDETWHDDTWGHQSSSMNALSPIFEITPGGPGALPKCPSKMKCMDWSSMVSNNRYLCKLFIYEDISEIESLGPRRHPKGARSTWGTFVLV